MVQFDNFVDGVSIHLGTQTAGAVPRTAIIFAVRQAVKQFCDESLAYIVRASADNQLATAPNFNPAQVFMTQTGKQCELTLPRNTHIIKVWQTSRCPCQRVADDILYDFPNIIWLNDENDKADEVVVSLSVTQNALECPDFIYHQYYDGILSGTIAYLQTMPNREWAMPNFAENHAKKFADCIKQAKNARDKGFRRRANTTVPAKFG